MAGEFQFSGTSGLTHKVVLRNAAGQVWRVDTAAFGAWSDAQIANYGIAVTEQGASGWFAGNMPAGVTTPGLYSYAAYQLAGGSLALTDQPPVAVGGAEWDGSALIVPLFAAAVRAALGLANANLDTQLDALPTAAEAAAALAAKVLEGTVTWEQALRLIAAAAGGKLSGAATTTVTIRDLADTKNRVVATVDADGNRSAVTRDLT